MRTEVYTTDKRLFGYLETANLHELGGRRYVFRITEDVGFCAFQTVGRSASLAPPEKRAALDIEIRGVMVDKMDVERGLVPPEIPAHAEREENPQHFTYRFTWRVLRVPDAAVAELLFDEPAFEAGGEPCGAAKAEKAWWSLHDLRAAGFHEGGITPARHRGDAVTFPMRGDRGLPALSPR